MEKVNHANFKDRTGEIHITNQCCMVIIIKYYSARNCTIQYLDGSVICNLPYESVRSGAVKNLNYPSVCGVGYIGYGVYDCDIKSYSVWTSMLGRCYNEKARHLNRSYTYAEVCQEWKCFQNFAKWYESKFDSETMEGWELDKDILCLHCKFYSPETCRLVPPEINGLYINLSKAEKEFTGIRKRRNVFQARITFKNKEKNVGHYKSRELAAIARENYKKTLFQNIADKWRGLVDNDIIEAVYNYYK